MGLRPRRPRSGRTASRIGISGASAGGGLAAGLALLARDRAELDLAFQMLIYPMIDDRQETPSSQLGRADLEPGRQRVRVALLSRASLRHRRHPAVRGRRPGPPTCRACLPPLYVVGTMDGFCDEDIAYAQRLNQAGVPTELHVYPGAPHGFDGMAPRRRSPGGNAGTWRSGWKPSFSPRRKDRANQGAGQLQAGA